ncbi:chromosomal replication initiator protein DnaA [soil metagenome]
MPLISSENSTLASRIEAAFAASIGAARYQLWFPPNAQFQLENDTLIVHCRNAHFTDWAADQFGETLKASALQLLGHELVVNFVTTASRFEESAELIANAKKPLPAVNLMGERELPAKSKPRPELRSNLRRWKLLKDFVVGPSNRVAAAAAQAVLDEPGLGPNPLVLFGPVGTGKTHLLEAIYAALPKKNATPLFVTAEDFTHRFVQSTRTQRTSSFRRQFRDADGLMLDDVNFLANKRSTQEEFLHTLDSLVADGKPVVLTMDTHPRLAEELMPELVDRLLGGAAWGLLPPDDETRLSILRAKCSHDPMPEDVLKFLARSLTGNVRELEGAVHALRHYAKVTQQPLTVNSARDALGDLLRHTVRTITLTDIDTVICRVLKLNLGTLQSKARTHLVTQPRMLAVLLARKHTAATYGEIAKHFGVRQHSTAVAGEKRARQWLKDNTQLPIGDRNWPANDLVSRIERELLK